MASLRVGLGQNNLKFSKVCFDHRYGSWEKARPVRVEVGGGSFFRRGCVVACSGGGGGGAGGGDGLGSGEGMSVIRTMFERNVAERKKNMEEEGASSGNIDMWLVNSIKEIVSETDEAPFLVHVYPEDNQGSRGKNTRIVREKASVDSWPDIKHRWEMGGSIPNGIALVEELKFGDDKLLPDPEKSQARTRRYDDGDSTKVFGILFQERGLSYPTCYLLKTDSVLSSVGICTHFCIFRVQSFDESVDELIKRNFLL